MIRIALVGCTGSIGRQVCDVVRKYPDRFCFSALVCGRDGEALSLLAKEFRPQMAALAEKETVISLPDGVRRLKKEELVATVFEGCDVAFVAAGGFAGLAYTLQAARMGKKIALANKESLVCGGELVMAEIARSKSELVPVDSEHSALFQALSFRRNAPFEKLILTASGGPFFSKTEEELRCVTAQDALCHPTWNMGAKITIDSATLLNKGYEVIEAKWLYGASFDRVEAIVHPESIVHSLVAFADGAMLAQLGYPDMKVPIQLALTYPERLPCIEQLDLAKLSALHFYPLPQEKFPCYRIALQAGKAGGIAPTVLNGAAEIAVQTFLQGRISFLQIADTVKYTLDTIANEHMTSFEQLEETDARARICATEYCYGT